MYLLYAEGARFAFFTTAFTAFLPARFADDLASCLAASTNNAFNSSSVPSTLTKGITLSCQQQWIELQLP